MFAKLVYLFGSEVAFVTEAGVEGVEPESIELVRMRPQFFTPRATGANRRFSFLNRIDR